MEKAVVFLKKLELLELEFKEHRGRNLMPRVDYETVKRTEKQKWCKLHRTRSHSNDECIKQKEYKQQNNFKQGNLILREPESNINTLALKGKIEGKELNFIFDTGAQFNYINEKIAMKLKLREKICWKN